MRSKLETQSHRAAPDFETIVTKEQEIARALREVAIKDSEYVSLQQVTVAGLEEVQQFIPDRTTLIEYFITQQEVIAFVISRRTARAVRRLARAGHVRTLQEKLLFQLEKFLLGPEFVSAHSRTNPRSHDALSPGIAQNADRTAVSGDFDTAHHHRAARISALPSLSCFL